MHCWTKDRRLHRWVLPPVNKWPPPKIGKVSNTRVSYCCIVASIEYMNVSYSFVLLVFQHPFFFIRWFVGLLDGRVLFSNVQSDGQTRTPDGVWTKKSKRMARKKIPRRKNGETTRRTKSTTLEWKYRNAPDDGDPEYRCTHRTRIYIWWKWTSTLEQQRSDGTYYTSICVTFVRGTSIFF